MYRWLRLSDEEKERQLLSEIQALKPFPLYSYGILGSSTSSRARMGIREVAPTVFELCWVYQNLGSAAFIEALITVARITQGRIIASIVTSLTRVWIPELRKAASILKRSILLHTKPYCSMPSEIVDLIMDFIPGYEPPPIRGPLTDITGVNDMRERYLQNFGITNAMELYSAFVLLGNPIFEGFLSQICPPSTALTILHDLASISEQHFPPRALLLTKIQFILRMLREAVEGDPTSSVLGIFKPEKEARRKKMLQQQSQSQTSPVPAIPIIPPPPTLIESTPTPTPTPSLTEFAALIPANIQVNDYSHAGGHVSMEGMIDQEKDREQELNLDSKEGLAPKSQEDEGSDQKDNSADNPNKPNNPENNPETMVVDEEPIKLLCSRLLVRFGVLLRQLNVAVSISLHPSILTDHGWYVSPIPHTLTVLMLITLITLIALVTLTLIICI